MEENIFNESTPVAELNSKLNDIRNEIAKVIVGQKEVIDLLIIGLLCDGHLLLEGVPGVAKTLAAKLLAKIIDVNFSRLQFTPDLMPGDVIGTSVFNPKEGAFYFKSGPVFSNIVLIDEINRSPAKTQSALFEVIEEDVPATACRRGRHDGEGSRSAGGPDRRTEGGPRCQKGARRRVLPGDRPARRPARPRLDRRGPQGDEP